MNNHNVQSISDTFDKSKISLLKQCVEYLPTYGTIAYDDKTCYWYIKLPNEWQNEKQNIAELAFNLLKHTKEYPESIKLCKEWSSLIHESKQYKADINCVSPPSIAGLHISLQRNDNNNKPKQLIKGKKVSFSLYDMKLLFTIREHPQNIPGQYTSEHGLRYYPTLWVLADIKFIDFVFETRYPPHISLACVAVQLPVNDVAKFELNKESKENDD